MGDIITLLTQDATELALGALLQPTWGVYLNGVPVIQPATIVGNLIENALAPIGEIASLIGAPNIVPVTASTVDFEYAQDFPLSNYPQELGAFQSYNKVTLPFDVKLRLTAGGSVSARQNFLSTCLTIASSMALFDVVTPELVFPSVNCSHISWPRSAKRGNTLITVELYFEQINQINATNFSNTLSPTSQGQQSIGNVQPQTPNTTVDNAFQNIGVN